MERWTSDNYEEIAERLEAILFYNVKKESLLESDDIRIPFRELIAQILKKYTVDNSEYEKEISTLGGIDYQKLITTNYDPCWRRVFSTLKMRRFIFTMMICSLPRQKIKNFIRFMVL